MLGVGAVGLLVLLAFAVGVLWPMRDLELNGRSLAFWLQDLKSTDQATSRAAEAVLAAHSSQVVPFLAGELRRAEVGSPLMLKLASALPRSWGRWLVQRLRPPEQTNRRAKAAHALGVLAVASPEVIAALGRGLHDADAHVQQACLNSLFKLGSAGAAQVLEEIPSLSGLLKRAAVAGIGPQNSSAPEAIAVFLAELERVEEPAEAGLYGSALARFGADAVPAVLQALDKGETAEGLAPAVLALKQACVDNFRFFTTFLAELPRQPAWVRLNSVEIVCAVELHPGYRVVTLARLVSDPDPEVRAKAAAALLRQSDRLSLAVPELLSALRSGSVEQRKAAVQVLGRLGPVAVPAIEELGRLRADPSTEVQAAALVALDSIGEAETKAAADRGMD